MVAIPYGGMFMLWQILKRQVRDYKEIQEILDLYQRKLEEGNIVVQQPIVFAENTKNQRANISPSLRFDILTRDNYTCQLCGKNQRDGAKLEVDHKLPVAKGGTNEIYNLWTLCWTCNSGKSSKVIDSIVGSKFASELVTDW